VADFQINLIYRTADGAYVHHSDQPDPTGRRVLRYEFRVHDLRQPWQEQTPFEAWLEVKLKDAKGQVRDTWRLGPTKTFNQPPDIANRWMFTHDATPTSLEGALELSFHQTSAPGVIADADAVRQRDEKRLGHPLQPTTTVGAEPVEKRVPDTSPARRTYRTIQAVLDDPQALRRRRVLLSAAKTFPAFNTWTANPANAPKDLKRGGPSNFPGNGNWVFSYEFNGNKNELKDTSCTSINPMVNSSAWCTNKDMSKSSCPNGKNCRSNWAFNAPKNKGWIPADKDHLPNVGDTYILMNSSQDMGHVGIVLQVPEGGNGLWVTGDGGQGDRGVMQQYAVLLPRWGVMAAHLPQDGGGAYPGLMPDPGGGPYLSGYGPADFDKNVTAKDGDGPAVAKRLKYAAKTAGALPKPRKVHGFVNIDEPTLAFDTDASPPLDAAAIQLIEELRAKVTAVADSFRAGQAVEGYGAGT
jgi:hypothetical protein